MKARTWKRVVRGLALAWLAVAEATSARAQVEDDAVTVPLVFYSEFYTLGGEASISVTGPGASASGYTTYPNPLWMNTNQAVAQVRPGKDYYFSVTVQNLQQWRPRFCPPVGMKVFVSDVERPGVNYSPSFYLNTIKVRVEDPTIAGPGEASGLRPGRVIWSAGLGALKNGDTAGVISLRELGLTANSYTPAALNYDTSSTDVSRIFVSGTSTLRQVFAPQCLADITAPNSYSFRLKFYGRPQITTQNGDLTWNVTGTPFVEYLVENSSYPSTTKLKITRTANFGGTKSWWTEIEKIGSDWKVTDWTESSLSALSTVRYAYADFDRDETIEARDGSYVSTYARTKNRFDDFAWGRELTSSQVGFGGSNPMVTAITYEINASTWGAYTRAKWRVDPTGNWEGIAYTSLGLPSRICRPFLDAPATPQNTSDSVGDVTSVLYGPAWDNIYSRPTNVTRRINNVQVGQTANGFNETTTRLSRYDNLPPPNNPTTLPMLVTTNQEYSSAGAYVTTITTTYREDADPGPRRLPGLPHSVQRPDGTMEVHLYFRGTYDSWWRQFYPSTGGFGFAEYVLQGTTAPQSGDNAVLLTSYGPADQSNYVASNFYVVPGQSTMGVTVRDFDGTLAMTQSWTYTSSGWVLVDRVTTVYDATYRVFPTNVRRDSGDATSAGDSSKIMEVSETGWQYGRVQWSADSSGAKRWFNYDAKGRVTQERLESIVGQPQAGEQWTIHTFDPVDRETRTTLSTNGSGGDPANDVVTETDYDLASRVTQTRRWGQTGWLTTDFRYFEGGNPRISKVYQPPGYSTGPTTISEVYLDGRAKSVTGTAQAPGYLGYTVQSNGNVTTQQRLVASAGGDGWVDTEQDWLGRTVFVLRPTGNGSTNCDNHTYNSLGQLVTRQLNVTNGSTALLAPTRYVYNSMGAVSKEGMDLDGTTGLNDTGADRVTTRGFNVVSVDGAWWSETVTKTLTNPANATDAVTSTVRSRLTGKTSSLQAETWAIDANNQRTTEILFVDRANKTVEQRTSVPGSTITAKKITKNGFLAQTISPENVTTTFTYDVYGRLIKAQGRESVFDEKTYHPKSNLVKNLRNAILGQGFDWQIFSYDSSGRLVTHETNNAWNWKTARYEYDAAGRLIHQWGDAATPVEYVYNSYGWKTNMRLYRGGSGWNNATWPAGTAGTADTTTWSYHMPTGLVNNKADPAGRNTTFTFNHRNQVATREWHRLVPAGQPNAGQRVKATYGYYDPGYGYLTGEPRSIEYNDGTPNVNFFLDGFSGGVTRTGQLRRVQDATGWREFFYRTNDTQQQAERLEWGFFGQGGAGGREVYRAYDTLGRANSVQVGWEDSSHLGNAPTTVDHDTVYTYDSTAGRVYSIEGRRPSAGATRTFYYGYRANSNLVQTVTSGAFVRTTQHQTWRNSIDNVTTTWDGATKANFHYDYDWIEQRIGQDHNDELATQLGHAGGIRDTYLFTPKGELDWVDVRQMSDNAQLTDRYRDWTYDSAGNRRREIRSGDLTVFGEAYDQYGQLILDGGNPQKPMGTGGNNLNQDYRLSRFNLTAPFVLQQMTEPLYDLDGNLINDGTWWYYWDAENRLTVAQKQDWTKRVESTYDYLGRRVRKKVKNGGDNADPIYDHRFVHDGHNIIAEYDGISGSSSNIPLLRTFTWGLDVTGTVHGGGGVGGLLMTIDYVAWDHYLPVYDANGNVRGMLGGGVGNWIAAYGYSAAGEVLQASGSYAATNPFLFASKWYDAETQLYQYNHRTYSPKLGRFLSRDPIGENGGLNLYAYCGNDPVGCWDYLGYEPITIAQAAVFVINTAIEYVVGHFLKKVWHSIFGGGAKPYVSPYSRPDNPQDRSFHRFATDEVAANSELEKPGQRGKKITDQKLLALYYRALENIRKNAPDFYARYMEALARGRVTVDAFTNIVWQATEKATGRIATAYQGGGFRRHGGPHGGEYMRFVINSTTSLKDMEAVIIHEGTHMIDAILDGNDITNTARVDLELKAYKATEDYMMKVYGRHAEDSKPYLTKGKFDEAKFRKDYENQRGFSPTSPYENITITPEYQTTIRDPATEEMEVQAYYHD